jgi:hypothetical protein
MRAVNDYKVKAKLISAPEFDDDIQATLCGRRTSCRRTSTNNSRMVERRGTLALSACGAHGQIRPRCDGNAGDRFTPS